MKKEVKKKKGPLKSFHIKFWIKGLDEQGVPIDWAREAYDKKNLIQKVSEECQHQIIVHSINELK